MPSKTLLCSLVALTALAAAPLTCALAEPNPVATTQVAPAHPSLLPLPEKVEWKEGSVTLNAKTKIIAQRNSTAYAEAQVLAEMLSPATGLPLSVLDMPTTSAMGVSNSILLHIDPTLESSLGKEGYRIDVVGEIGCVSLTAATPAGLFYAGQTLRQLLPTAIFSPTAQPGVKWEVPACAIQDKPRFAWRGFMLDYSRHWFDKAYTKHLLDGMAMHKLNVFHMHLADDEGWRIEIKKYPKLTEIGAWRGKECTLHGVLDDKDVKRYGGFFTQDDIREIVAYAAKLHINVMPEIDLPGHSLAICTAYPETRPLEASGAVSPQGIAGNVISPAKEANYAMIDDIYGELAGLFPFEYVHIGGDEVNHNAWKNDSQIKDLIAREKLGGLGGAQVYFTKRLEGILAKHHKKMIGWNEILNDKLARSTGIMAWTGTGPGYEAAKKGFPVVMAPGPHNYFDMAYPNAIDEPRGHGWAGTIDAKKTYSFNPVNPKDIDETSAKHVLGVHACLWAEYVSPFKSASGWANFTREENADYKIFPRLCALAEVGWTAQNLRNFTDFESRLGPAQFERLNKAGFTTRLDVPKILSKGGVSFIPPFAGAEVFYTLDGSDPFNSKTAKKWDGQLLLASPLPHKVSARTFLEGQWSPRVELINK